MNNLKIIANWKMNGSKEEVESWINNFSNYVESKDQSQCILCPPSCYLNSAKEIIANNNLTLNLGSQDLDSDQDYPSTGGINGKMLKDLGCDYVLIGHSERRIHFKEDENILSMKLSSAIQNNIKVIDVRHEATAVFAADAISRLSPAIGVAAVTAGPGLTNTLTAVKNLQMAQVPEIVCCAGGCVSAVLLHERHRFTRFAWLSDLHEWGPRAFCGRVLQNLYPAKHVG